jgi:DNA-directed RNA polymerase specialized sigma24 family protein
MESTAKQVAPAGRPAAENSWDAFVDWYGRSILDWFRASALSTKDADVLVREIMQLLAREFAKVASEPKLKFRGWLQYAIHAAWCKLMERCVGDGGKSQNSPVVALLLSVEAHDNFMKAMDAECTIQRRREVLPRIQALADPADWEAFYFVALERNSPAEAAEQIVCSEFAVRIGMHRVDSLLQQELQKIEEAC